MLRARKRSSSSSHCAWIATHNKENLVCAVPHKARGPRDAPLPLLPPPSRLVVSLRLGACACGRCPGGCVRALSFPELVCGSPLHWAWVEPPCQWSTLVRTACAVLRPCVVVRVTGLRVLHLRIVILAASPAHLHPCFASLSISISSFLILCSVPKRCRPCPCTFPCTSFPCSTPTH